MIVNWKERNTVDDGCGGVIYKVLDIENSRLKKIEVSMCVFAPSERARSHYHKKMEEIYFIIEGDAEIEIQPNHYRLKAEDAISIPVGTVHRITNLDKDKPLRFLSINSPHWQDEDMIEIKG